MWGPVRKAIFHTKSHWPGNNGIFWRNMSKVTTGFYHKDSCADDVDGGDGDDADDAGDDDDDADDVGDADDADGAAAADDDDD